MTRKALILLVLAALAGPVLADRVDSARFSLDIANRNLAVAVGDVENARRALDVAIADHNAAVDHLRSAESHVAALDAIRRDPAAIDRMAADLQATTQREEQINAALQAAQARYDQAAAAVEQIRSRARTDFEASPAFGQSTTALRDAQQRLAEVQRTSNDSLLLEPRFVRLQERADAIEAELKRMRDDPSVPQEVLARASSDWMAAESEVNRFKQQWLDNDRNILDAQAQLDRANSAGADLEQQFETSLSADPRYRELLDARNGEQNAIAQITKDLHENRRASEDLQQRVDTARAQLADANLNFAAATQDLDVARQQVAVAASQVAGCEQAIRWAQDGVDRAVWQRDAAARDFELAIRDRDHDHDRDREERDRFRNEESARQREIERRNREREDREADFRRNEQSERDRREREEHERRLEQGRQDSERARKEVEQRDRDREQREAEFRKQREQQEARERKDREAQEVRQRQDAQREQETIRKRQEDDSRRREEDSRRRADEQRQRDDDAKRKEAEDRAERERQQKQRESDENDRGRRYSR